MGEKEKSKKPKVKKKVEWCFPGAERRGQGELLFNGYRILVLQHAKYSGDTWWR